MTARAARGGICRRRGRWSVPAGSWKFAYSHLREEKSLLLPKLQAVICISDATHGKGHGETGISSQLLAHLYGWNYEQLSLVSQHLLPGSQGLHILTGQTPVSLKRGEAAWPRAPRLGETFESWPRLTSNPPAVDSCDAPAS